MEQTNTKLLLFKLNCLNIENAMEDLCQILRSSIGKYSNLKMFTSRCGFVHLTSCSSLIADRLQVESILCLYINRTIKCLPDFGLYFGVISTFFLKNILKYCDFESRSDLIGQVKKLKSTLRMIVDSRGLKLRLEMFATNLLLLLESIIGAKPSINLVPDLLSSLSLNILKAFLMSLNDNRIKTEHLLTVVENGKEEFRAFKGVLHPINNIAVAKQVVKFNCGGKTKILLFVSLNLNDDHLNAENRFILALENAIKNQIRVVICQKVIKDRIKLLFRSRSVLFFERVGQEVIQSLEFLTSGCLISDIDGIDQNDLIAMAGTITDIQLVTCAINKYVLFENHLRSVASLLVQTRVLGTSTEMKTVIKQCIDTLCLLVKSQYVVCGGGCFETELTSQILNYSEDDPRFCYIKTLFSQSLLQGIASFPNVCIDRNYKHTWETNTEGCCRCGMVCNRENIQFECLHLSEVKLLGAQKDCMDGANNSKITKTCSLFDCYQTKLNALLQSLDSISSILEIGLVIKKF